MPMRLDFFCQVKVPIKYSGADSIGHGRARVLPLLQMAGHGGTVSGRTANKN